MTKELCSVIDQLSREKGISREALVKVLEAALLSSARKKYGGRTNINLRIDSKTCDIQVYETKKVAEKIDGQTFFIGRIVDVGEGWVRIKTEAKAGEKDIFIPSGNISKARLEIEMKKSNPKDF